MAWVAGALFLPAWPGLTVRLLAVVFGARLITSADLAGTASRTPCPTACSRIER